MNVSLPARSQDMQRPTALACSIALFLALSALSGCFEDADSPVKGGGDIGASDALSDIDDPCNGEIDCPCTLDEQCVSNYCELPDDPTQTVGVCAEPCGGGCPEGETCKSVGRGGKKKYVCIDDNLDPGCVATDEVCDGKDNNCNGVTDEATCDDNNVCTVDDCQPSLATSLPDGCTFTGVSSTCEDGDLCTEGEICAGGNCQSGAAKDCDDSNPCTTDACDATTGACEHPIAEGPCDDGSPCTSDDACAFGVCSGGNLFCDDGNPCTDDTCDVGTGPGTGGCVSFNNSAPCSDGDPCTVPDTCQDGACAAGITTTCDDDNVCTEDHCDPSKVSDLSDGCTATNLLSLCEDGDNCTLGDSCKLGVCAAGVAADCDDSNPCTADTCDKETGNCNHAPSNVGAVCNDKNPCTLNDVCDVGAVCIGAATDCVDGEGCTYDICDVLTGKCYHENNSGFACEDGSACTLGDACIGGSCVSGKKKLCDDSLPCTNDACDAQSGSCVFTPNTSPCDDGNPCTQKDACAAGACAGTDPIICNDGNACTLEACDTALGKCEVNNAADNVLCQDGDACSAGDACKKGVCTAGPVPYCGDDNSCTDDSCDATTGKCVATFNKAGCDDGNSCTADDACDVGSCKGGQNTCECQATSDCAAKEDGNACNGKLVCNLQSNKCEIDQNSVVVCDPSKNTPCATFSCKSASGVCEVDVKPDNTACEADDSVCTVGDQCAKGQCVPGKATVCKDENDCTDDSCDPKTGCLFANNAFPCFDGDLCTKGDQCKDGACGDGGVSKDCDDNDVCSKDSCNSKTGNCTFEPLSGGSCNDGNACTKGDLCEAGGCVGGTATICNDGNPCTLDTCDSKTGKCAATPDFDGLGCDDGKPCTKGDTCGGGVCKSGIVPSCDDGSPCTKGVCVPTTGECAQISANNGQNCSDGNACTLKDVCKNGLCTAADSKLCDDGNVCTADVCDSASGGCTYQPVVDGFSCDDGSLCTFGDACKAGVCTPKSTAVCDDTNECTDDACDDLTGKCVYKPVPVSPLVNCNDGNACTYDTTTYIKYGTVKDACYLGKCSGSPISCNDGNVCTTDSCDPAKGCKHVQLGNVLCNDGNACTTGDNCSGGSCKGAGKTCNDGNQCTSDSCSPSTGCAFTPNNNSCNDGSKCTTVDACTGGVCKGAKPLNCDDGKPCTDDLCDPSTACYHTNDDTNPCSDEEPCTANDHCDTGACAGGGPTDCDDKSACTNDSCENGKGCLHLNLDNQTCDDGNACTEKDVCASGKCAASGALDCNDKDVCTTDSCDPKNGCQHAAFTGPCDDGDACTSGDKCVSGQCTATGVTKCDDASVCTADSCDALTGCVFAPTTGTGTASISLNSDIASQTSTEIVDGKPASLKPAQVVTNPPAAWAKLNGAYWIAAEECATSAKAGQMAMFGRELTLPAAAKVTSATLQVAGAGNYSCMVGNKTVLSHQGDGGATTTKSANVTAEIGAGATYLVCNLSADGQPATGGKLAPCGLLWKLDVQVEVQSVLCDDGNACTSLDLCEKGVCTGTNGQSCNDGNPCTSDACDPLSGCAYKPANANPCSDGDACTAADYCSNGKCVSTAVTNCSDGSDCTVDSCDSVKGCGHVDVELGAQQTLVFVSDSKSQYTKQIVINNGQEEPVALAAAVPTYAGFAEWTKIPGATWIWSDAIVADPSKDETVWFGREFKVPAGSAQVTGTLLVSADASYECRINSKLVASSGSDPKPWLTVGSVPVGSYLKSDDNHIICRVTNKGIPGSNILNNPAGLIYKLTINWFDAKAAKPCSDGNACSKEDGCVGGTCVSGPVLDCDDSNSCTVDACSASNGCSHIVDNKQPCNDGSVCTEGDICKDGACKGQKDKVCEDANACTVDGCDAITGCLGSPVLGNPGCDDASPCTASSFCDAGVCKGGDVTDCNDGKPCTVDACDTKTGCTHKPDQDGKACDDGDVCTDKDLCANGLCLGKQTAPCDDGNACTKDSCDPAKGCVNTSVTGGVCDDGDACTDKDVCVGGQCKAGALKDCFDTEQCTSDLCDSKTGNCTFIKLSDGECDDGNLCTLNDACDGGKCKAGTPPPCGDNDACTVDNCDPATGKCLHDDATEGSACDNGNLCMLETKCTAKKCLGSAKNCNDSNACTADSCDPAVGKCEHAPLSDGTKCGNAGSCKKGVCLE